MRSSIDVGGGGGRYKSLTSRLMATLSAVAVMCGGSTAQAQSTGQDVYYSTLTATEQAEVSMWSDLYWERISSGGNPGQDFYFDSQEMNGPFFNPSNYAKVLLEELRVLARDTCTVTAPPTTAAARAALMNSPEVQALKAAMVDRLVTTDAVQNPEGTLKHVDLIFQSATGPSSVVVSGSTLATTKLPMLGVDDQAGVVAAQAVMPTAALTSQTSSIIAGLTSNGPAWAQAAITSGGVTEARQLITGLTSRADYFVTSVNNYIAPYNTSGMMSVEKCSARFALFGQLPIAVVQLDDAYVIMDTVSGRLVGPFAKGSPLDARSLLAWYPTVYRTGSKVAYTNMIGCTITIAADWNPKPPTNTPPTKRPKQPQVPGTAPCPGCPKPDPGVDGWPSKWKCSPVGTDCICVATIQLVYPPPFRNVTQEQTFKCGTSDNCPPPGDLDWPDYPADAPNGTCLENPSKERYWY